MRLYLSEYLANWAINFVKSPWEYMFHQKNLLPIGQLFCELPQKRVPPSGANFNFVPEMSFFGQILLILAPFLDRFFCFFSANIDPIYLSVDFPETWG